jgi:hypothetical protein
MSEGDRSPSPRPWPLHSGFQNSHGAAVKPVAFGLAAMAVLLSSFGCVGFSGSRSPGAESVAAVRVALSRVAPGASVLVGCAPGVDAVVRSGVPLSHLQVFSVGFTGFPPSGLGCRCPRLRLLPLLGCCWLAQLSPLLRSVSAWGAGGGLRRSCGCPRWQVCRLGPCGGSSSHAD